MKKAPLIIIAAAASILALTPAVLATSASPSATSTASPADDKTKQLEDLKNRLATQVAQLSRYQRQAIAGTITATSLSTITVETKTKDVKIELTDNIVVFQYLKGVRTKLTTDDLSKGDHVVVFGQHDVTLDLLQAKVIFIQTPPPVRVDGTIADIDRTQYTLTVNTPEGQSYVIDIWNTTKTFRWNEGQIGKSGFSKVALGETVFVLGTPDPKEANRYSGLRILDLGNLTAAATPAATSAVSSASATPPASSKITPTP